MSVCSIFIFKVMVIDVLLVVCVCVDLVFVYEMKKKFIIRMEKNQ